MDKLRGIGKNIKFLREARGLSQETLGLKAGFHRTYIGAVERGERNLTITNLCQLASALKVHPGILLFDDSFDWVLSRK
jgi:transcriptional regulator with XRE-family HTH domain